MVTAGVIAEYNPLHNGHAFLMNRLRQMGADRIAVVMSGNFVQRGDAAILSKWARTKQALLCGADLVVELPLPWAMAGAERFAQGGVFLLTALGADVIGFGSECGSLALLKKAQSALTSPSLHSEMKKSLQSGATFAAARQEAVSRLFGQPTAQLLREPNNVLGMEYLKAIKSIHSPLQPITVPRKTVSTENYASGGFMPSIKIRAKIERGEDFSAYVPDFVCQNIQAEIAEGHAPARLLCAERAVLATLRKMNREDFSVLPDLSEGLENRIYAESRRAGSITELLKSVKTKRYPMARIRRIVLSAFLGLKASDSIGAPPYCRILGIGKGGREILRAAKQKACLPIIAKHADYVSLDGRARRILELEAHASDLYALCMPKVSPCGSDFSNRILVLPSSS